MTVRKGEKRRAKSVQRTAHGEHRKAANLCLLWDEPLGFPC